MFMQALLLSLLLFTPLHLEGNNYFHVFEQRSPHAGVYFAPYHINGPTPDSFEEFFYFDVVEDANEKSVTGKFVRVAGAVHSRGGTRYAFSSAKLERDRIGISKLIFKTRRVKGIEYKFEGTFLDRPELLRTTGNYTDLRGTLTRKENGRTVARQQLNFFANIRE
jgi:hypothetical protein